MNAVYFFHLFRERLLKSEEPISRRNTQDSLFWMHQYLFFLLHDIYSL